MVKKQDLLIEIGTEELPPKSLKNLAAIFREKMCLALKDEELDDKNIVKAKVCLDRNNQGFAEDFLRTINSKKNWFHHIGLYVYRPKVLEKFVRLEQTKNEFDRKLEQMRAMDNFMKIKLVKVEDTPPSVDTMYDLKKIRLLFNSNNT